MSDPDALRVRRICSDPPVLFVRTLSSTSDTLRRWVAEGSAPPRATLLCAFQTGGRGRPGHRWQSRRGDLTMSRWILPEECFPAGKAFIPLAVAAACLITLDNLHLSGAFWKYPNDLYAPLSPGKPGGDVGKLGGLLVEPVRTTGGESKGWIAGIGINIGTLPPDPAGRDFSPASLTGLAGEGRPLPGPLSLARQLSQRISDILEHGSPAEILSRLEDRLLWKNRWVVYSLHGKTHIGKIEGLGDDGALLVTGDDGRFCRLGPAVRNLRPVSVAEVHHG